MTETTPYDTSNDPAQMFIRALPGHAQRALHHTARITVLVHRAVRDHGWTVQQLIDRCTGDLGANPGGVITFRLEHCADNPPPLEHKSRRIPFCSPECRDNAGWVLDDAGRPAERCTCRTRPQEVTA